MSENRVNDLIMLVKAQEKLIKTLEEKCDLLKEINSNLNEILGYYEAQNDAIKNMFETSNSLEVADQKYTTPKAAKASVKIPLDGDI